VIADPKQWRLDAARCLLLAAESATNLETREELIALAHIWLKRAAKLEVDLLKQRKGKYLDERGQKAALSRAEGD
jgi:hypothetical protein